MNASSEDLWRMIQGGRSARVDWLNGFYFGAGKHAEGPIAQAGGLKKLVGANLEEIDARTVNSITMFPDDPDYDNVVVLDVK